MQFTSRIHRAMVMAAQLHRGQRRKTDDIPYVSHPYAVAWIVSHYTDDEDIIIAALFHDVLEDVSGYSIQQMTEDFGARVSSLVQQVTEPEKRPDMTADEERETWEVRKKNFLNHLCQATPEALMIVAADKMHNMVSMVEAYRRMGEEVWQKFNAPIERRQWFHGEVVGIVQSKLQGELPKRLAEAYQAANRAFDIHPSAQ